MTKAFALARFRRPVRIDLVETVRGALVLSCGAALLAAGPLIPTLG